MSTTTPNDLETTRTRVRAALSRQLGDIVSQVPDEAALPETLGARYDSLAALECITRIEEEFGVEVDFVEHDVRYWFASIDRIARFTRDRLEDVAVTGGAR
jgi:acyl carrier protein